VLSRSAAADAVLTIALALIGAALGLTAVFIIRH